MSDTKRSLVTGAAGFLGSHLVDQLIKEGHDVIGIDNEINGSWKNLEQWANNPRFKKVHMDILNIQSDDNNFKNLDYVFHLAALECPITSLEKPEIFFTTNIHGTVKVLQASKQSNLQKFVYASSAAIYGDASTPTLETDSINPMTPSCLTKSQAEDIVFHWGDLFNIPTNSLRIFTAFGPRDFSKLYPGSAVGIWLKQKLKGKPLTVIGNGDHARDFVYCTDVANAFYIAALEGKDSEVYNIGSGQATTLNEFTDLLKAKKSYIKDKIDEPQKTWGDISKFQFGCNWQPRIPLTSGVEFSLDVLSDWKDAPDWDEESLNNFFKAWFEVYS